MEMPVPYCVYPEISEASTIWAGQRGYKRNHPDALQIQGCRNHQWGSLHRSCASVCEYPAQNERIEFYGVFEREKHTDDI